MTTVRKKWKTLGVPGSFSSAEYLAKSNRLDAASVKRALRADPVFESHRSRPKKLLGRPDVATFFSSRWEADLGDVGRAFNAREGDNKEHRYFLLAVDVFSRRVFATGLASKSGPDCASAVENILENLPKPYTPPRVLETDEGAEFTSKRMASVCKKYGVRLYVATGRNKARMAERHVRSLKKVLLTALKTDSLPAGLSWDGCVKATAASLNGRYNRSIGCSPDQAPGRWKKLMREAWKRKRLEPPGDFPDHGSRRGHDLYRVGDLVLVPNNRRDFKKESDPNYEVMPKTVARVLREQKPYLYVLRDPKRKRILKRRYYATELRPVELPAAARKRAGDIVDFKLEGGRVKYELSDGSWV